MLEGTGDLTFQIDFAAGRLEYVLDEMLNEEMEFLGPVKLSAVEAMQQEIVDIVRGLEDSGELEINSSGEEEQLVQ